MIEPSRKTRASRHSEPSLPPRKIRSVALFSAAVFVIFFAFVFTLLSHLGQGVFAATLAGFFVALTAAVEVGCFGGMSLFGGDE